MDSRFEVIDAFVDGERVDAVALKRALADEEARGYLVDAWLLREGVQDEMAVETVAALPARPPAKRVTSWMLSIAAAAACLVMGVVVGYRLNDRLSAVRATRVERPAASTTSSEKSFPVPAPTRVIQVEFRSGSVGGGQ